MQDSGVGYADNVAKQAACHRLVCSSTFLAALRGVSRSSSVTSRCSRSLIALTSVNIGFKIRVYKVFTSFTGGIGLRYIVIYFTVHVNRNLFQRHVVYIRRKSVFQSHD